MTFTFEGVIYFIHDSCLIKSWFNEFVESSRIGMWHDSRDNFHDLRMKDEETHELCYDDVVNSVTY